MKKIIVFCVFVLALVGCSSEQPVDLENVEAKLTTTPEVITAGSPAALRATFTGMTVSDEANVTFDFRTEAKPVLVDAVNEGGGVFTGSFTFPKKGIQTVYIHLYVDDIHLTEKVWVEVK
ncbi:hypothetical protein [Paenibacillus sp. NPDC057967]|uniref:hypothetical protein n=1 Tax=Paenibacillus sp. NPDC057967 TaxID=3346293 RepID=UPI0036DAEB6E